MTMRDLLGSPRPAIVVGAAQGIGFEVAAQLSRYAMASKLVLVDIDEEKLNEAAETLRADVGPEVEAIVADVGDEVAIAHAIQSFSEPGYGVVVAGMFEGGPTVEVERDSLERVLSVDLLGCLLAGRTIAGHFAKAGGGSLVVVTSTASRIPHLGQAAYAAAKAGLAQAMRVLGLELANDGVRINMVAPGPTNTRLVQRSFDPDKMHEGDHARYRVKIPRGRIAAAEEIASAVVVLLSDALRHVYFQELVVDGGETLGM